MMEFRKVVAGGLIAATALAFAGTAPAEAGCGLGCGLGIGIVGGVIAGAAIAAAQPAYPRYAPPPGVYYAPGEVYYQGPVYPGCRVYKWQDEWGRVHKDRICG
ncbi:hypothetical protein [Prosthecomicrobium sp. N25]|uniref:hypothetical protein n=1 Tax=Prosthecomicrobium sp. N25 TaxID=3129254 RepID=UPI0030783087